MFGLRPRNLLSKGAAGVLLLANGVFADNNEKHDHTIGLLVFAGALLCIACFSASINADRRRLHADEPYHELPDQNPPLVASTVP